MSISDYIWKCSHLGKRIPRFKQGEEGKRPLDVWGLCPGIFILRKTKDILINIWLKCDDELRKKAFKLVEKYPEDKEVIFAACSYLFIRYLMTYAIQWAKFQIPGWYYIGPIER